MLPPQLHIVSLGLANGIIVDAFVDYIDEHLDQRLEYRPGKTAEASELLVGVR
jgi:hypothetical protein